ncbi:hypothetical protein QBC34DRAFT_410456 [Podospora aff. communis PSN243]|uniref:Uncharacterized protein n=1 Tax=Podospora aff. communis PSN243 TaxID=3040156 RepID=A0AAV9GF94_9PEZI|nr:hypothetical protein QBC34DRAFT_410456 [Podospora aff. communis PSN243]
MSLLGLSSELLYAIASNLVPSMEDDTGSFDPDPDIRRCRLALLSLAKAGNHTLRDITIPHLYHTICIHDLRCLFDFLHTLVYHPHLADFVRILNLATSLDDRLDDETDAKSEALYRGITPDMKAFPSVQLCFGEDETEICWDNVVDFAEISFGLILCLTTKLQSLHLHLPNWNAGDCDSLAGVFESAYAEAPDGFLPRLSRLALTADPRADDPLLPEKTPHCFMGPQGNIKYLELFGANLMEDEAVADKPEKWRGLETIHVSYAHTTGNWWYKLCSKAWPELKSVDISISPYFGEGAIDGAGYNEAFALCTESLECLKLDFDYGGDYSSHLGPRKRLDCLSKMKKLNRLEVSVTALFTARMAIETVNICDVLPASLEEVCLRDDVADPWSDMVDREPMEGETTEWTAELLEKEHSKLVERSLLQLVLENEAKLPRLRQVRVIVNQKPWKFDTRHLEGLLVEETSTRAQSTIVTVTRCPRQSW